MRGSEDHFRQTFGGERAAVLLECIAVAEEEAGAIAAQHGLVRDLTNRQNSFDLATTALHKHFEPLDGVRYAESKGQVLWIVDEMYALRRKKLGERLLPANHPSGQQDLIQRHATLDGFSPLVFVSVGPRINRTTGLPASFLCVKEVPHPTKRKRIVEWAVDLEELAEGGGTSNTEILPLLPQAPAAPAAITPKRGVAQKPETEIGS